VRICRFQDPLTLVPTWAALDGDGGVHPLLVNGDPFPDIDGWLSREDALDFLKTAVRDAIQAPAVTQSKGIDLLAPIQNQEVWAAGVTYERSKVARMEESAGGGDFYDKVYDAERPEIFFKANARRVVAPGAPIRIRRDSTWDVPEPELALVLSASGEIVGYTAGNDVSSRSIEGENPLYLPQAKVYDGCCALGPFIALAGEGGIEDPRDLTISLRIARNGETAFEGAISVSRMKRSPEELRDYLFRENRFPEGVLLLTGTGIVPPDDFTLQSGDVTEIGISKVGTLSNPVA
jgi:2-dehydro-3-deoxy-D-arabinonate dehydratase